MIEGMVDQLPLTRETFFNPNRISAVKKVFPKLISPDSLTEAAGIKPDQIDKCLTALTEETWKSLGDDPILKQLGREKFDNLPEDQRLKILDNAVALLKASEEAEEFLKEK